jgi:hypothetical protein
MGIRLVHMVAIPTRVVLHEVDATVALDNHLGQIDALYALELAMAVESVGKLRRASHAVALAASRLRVTRARDLPAVCDSIRLSEAASGHGMICSPSNKTINLSRGFNPIFSSNARSRGERPGRRSPAPAA